MADAFNLGSETRMTAPVYTGEVPSAKEDEPLPGYEEAHDEGWLKWFVLSFLEDPQAHQDLFDAFSLGGNRVTRVEKIDPHHVWIIGFEMGLELRGLAIATVSRRIRGVLRKASRDGARHINVSVRGRSALVSFIWKCGTEGRLVRSKDGRSTHLLACG